MSEAVHRVGAVTGGFFSCSFGRKRLGGGGNERGDETRRTCNPWRSRYRVRERVSTLSSLVVLRISSVKPDPPTHTHSNHYQSLCFLLPFFFLFFLFYFFLEMRRTVANKAPLAPTLGIPVLVKFPPNTNP